MASSKKTKRELDCVLSPEELGLLGIKACEERDKARELKEEASALEKAAKEKEHQVANKKAKREVACLEVKDFARNEIRVERCDEKRFWPEGDPVVETRPMTGEERQTLIDTGDKPGGDEAKVATKAPAGRGRKKATDAPN
jgi:seryl-tRNA synthetase